MTTRRDFLKILPIIGLLPLIPIPRPGWRVWIINTPSEPQMIYWTADMEPTLAVAQWKTKEEIIKQGNYK